MKKFILLLSFTFTLINVVNSAHIQGGELTWECLNSGSNKGKFIFKLRVYRSCNQTSATGFPTPTILNPFGSAISLTLIDQYPIQLQCYDTSLSKRCFSKTYPRMQFVQEVFEFRSAPVAINGTPSSGGSEFVAAICCRPGFMGGFTSHASFYIKAIMYPYSPNGGSPKSLGTASNPSCYDSSPQFIGDPLPAICNRFQINHSIPSYDPDLDSVAYYFCPAFTSSIISVPYNSGFSFNSPLPSYGIPSDTNNIGVSINNFSGAYNFTPFDTNRYHTAVEVRSYRDGKLIASIMRELPIKIVNCAPMPPPFPPVTYNKPPTGNFTYKSATVGNLNLTVYAGELVEFNVEAEDLELLPTLAQQSVIIEPVTELMGLGFADSTAGCLRPPCLTMDTSISSFDSLYWKQQSSLSVPVKWRTDCSHLRYSKGVAVPTNYQIRFKVYDDFCPMPGYTTIQASVTILPDTNSSSLIAPIDSINFDGISAILNWQPYVGTGFSNYYVYKLNDTTQKFEIVKIESNVSTTSYTDPNPYKLNHYYVLIDTVNKCPINYAFSTINMDITQNPVGTVKLEWNKVIEPDSTLNIEYQILASVNSSPFVPLDTTDLLTFIDSINNCADSIQYKIVATLNNQFLTASEIKTHYIIQAKYFSPYLRLAVNDTAGNVVLNWDTVDIKKSWFSSYHLLRSTSPTGPFFLVDSFTTQGRNVYVDINSGADTIDLYYRIVANIYSPCQKKFVYSQPSNTLKSNLLKINNLNDGLVQLEWSPFFNSNIKTTNGNYFIYKRKIGSSWLKIGETPYGIEIFTDTVAECNVFFEYKIEMDTMGILVSVNNFISVSGYEIELEFLNDSILIGPIGSQMKWYVNDTLIDSNKNEIVPHKEGSYTYKVLLSNGCELTSKEFIFDTLSYVGIKNAKTNTQLKLYPNPSNGEFTVEFELHKGDYYTYEIISITGQVVFNNEVRISKMNSSYKSIIDLENLSKGLYYFNFNVNGSIQSRKIIIQ